MAVRSTAVSLVAIFLLAGCFADAPAASGPEPDVAGGASAGGGATATTTAGPGASGAGGGSGAAGPTRPAPNTTSGPAPQPPYDPGWPALEDARIRPGLQILYLKPAIGQVYESETKEVSGCTANFLFRSPDNGTIYLGTAAHCVDDLPIGAPVPLGKDVATATLAWSSWHVLRARGATDEDASPLRENDFALLALDDAARAMAHPAMFHYGGPTAVAPAADLAVGDGALMYGNSDLRRGRPELAPHEGCISWRNEWMARFYFPNPVLPGDSGSPVLAADGRALGVMIRLGGPRGTPGTDFENGNGLTTNLEPALAFARAEGMAVELVTWPLLAKPTLPTTPCPAP